MAYTGTYSPQSDHGGGDIKGCVHRKPTLGEWEVLQQCVAQIANADHDEVVVVVHAQDMTDLGPQFFYIVAVALLAELTETAEILAGSERR